MKKTRWSGEKPTGQTEDEHQAPPHSVEAEQGTLGSMLVDPKNTIPEVVEKISEEYFYVPAHRTMYQELIALHEKGQAIDMITLTNYLRDKGALDSIGGASFVTNLFLFVPTSANVQYYLDILRDKYLLRQVIAAGTESVRRAYEEQDEVGGLLDEIVLKFQAIPDVGLTEVDTSIRPLVISKIEHMENGIPDEDIIPTGLIDLDAKSPLKRGDMPLIMGKRKSGKSVLALTIAQNVARNGMGVLYFSLEDRSSKPVDRLIAGATRIAMWKNHISKLDEEEVATWMSGASKLMDFPIWIRDDAFDLSKISAITRQVNRKQKAAHQADKNQPELVLVIVDYAQLVRGRTTNKSTREQEVSSVSRTLRLLAMETNLAICVLSQLNKDGESRESKALEQDATAGWKIEFNEEDPKVRSLYIPWQRNGDSGALVNVAFIGEIARFENLSQKED